MALYVGANTEKEDQSGNQSDSYAERFPDVISVATYQSPCLPRVPGSL